MGTSQRLARHLRPGVEIKFSLVRSLGLRHSLRRWRLDRAFAKRAAGRQTEFAKAMWAEAAADLHAEFQQISPRLIEVRRGDAKVHLAGQQTSFADPVSIELTADKQLAYELLRNAGLSVPERILVARDDHRTAREFLEASPVPCVVKPVRGGGGQGVTGAVRSAGQLLQAMRRAGRDAPKLLIERHVAGDHYRLLLLDGEVLDVLRRVSARVLGDGRSSIEQLMFEEYERRLGIDGLEGLKPFVADLDCLFTLEQQGLQLSSIPSRGTAVTVKTATNVSGPSDCITFKERLSPELVAEARTAAATVGVRLAGVDVLTVDSSLPLVETGGAVLEVNPVPGLVHHYNVADSAGATKVAVPILRALLEEASRRTTGDREAGASGRAYTGPNAT
jgi:cyanophycin synthetase